MNIRTLHNLFCCHLPLTIIIKFVHLLQTQLYITQNLLVPNLPRTI